MERDAKARRINPQLGTYFGIFAAAFTAVVLLTLMLEQLGVGEAWIRLLMFATPIVLFAVFAASVATDVPRDFFAAGRRIPPFFAGLVLALTSLGGIGFVCLPGVLFHMGIDGFAVVMGLILGLMFMGMMLTPFLRKSGAFTVPSFLGQRLESRTVRVAAAAMLIVPVALMSVAELKVAALAASRLVGVQEGLMIPALAVIAGGLVVGGGLRSLTWSSAAKGIVAMVALSVPVTIVAAMISGLPIPQMVHGNLLRTVARNEALHNMPMLLSEPMLLALPGTGLEPIGKQFLQSFGSIGPAAFVCLVLAVAAGTAAMPTLLHRSGTTPGVHAARKSIGWAIVIAGFAVATAASVAVFMRGLLLDQVVGVSDGAWPAWFETLRQLGIAEVADKLKPVVMTAIAVDRDAVVFALPIAAGLPAAALYLVYAGALAAALAAVSAGLVTIGTILAEDVVTGLLGDTPADRIRVITARLGIAAATIVVTLLCAFNSDPLQLALTALSIAGATGFPVLVLSVLWKRLTAVGALAGMATGFAITVATLLVAEAGASSFALPLPAVAGLAAALAATVAVSLITPAVGRHALEFVRDIRVPGGETLYDRRMRLERLRKIGIE